LQLNENDEVALTESKEEQKEHMHAPPQGASRHWKEIYSAVSNYVKQLKE